MTEEVEAVELSPPLTETMIEHLPSAVMGTILTKLDVPSLCSIAATCKSLRACASSTFSFVPSFHLTDIAPTLDLLRPLLPPNPYLHSLKLDCSRLNDSAIVCLLRPSLYDLFLLNCHSFSGRLLEFLGRTCPNLRSLSLTSLAEQKRVRPSLLLSDLEQLLNGCSQLESLCLAFDMSTLADPKFGQVWTVASGKLSALRIGYIPMKMVTEMLNISEEQQHYSHPVKPPIFLNLQRLCLSVDNITDAFVTSITKGLVSLTHLDLQDAPTEEPVVACDLTNAGIQQINPRGKLKHISLIRSPEFLCTYFRRVNDLGILLMADTCSTLESICLGGFCRVTDTGFRAILHSCSSLHSLKVLNGFQLTDLVFHDISATYLLLTHVSLRRCNLLTNLAIVNLSFNSKLNVLDLRDCRNLGDEALRAASKLPKLKILLLDGTDIGDLGLSYLSHGMSSLVSLSLRGCQRLTDNGISFLFAGSLGPVLKSLDFSSIRNLSDNVILMLAKSGVSLKELRMRNCPLIGDTSVMALASMHVNGLWCGSSLHLLDLYECRGITQLAFRWFKRPYFPRLRWLGVTGSTNRDMVDALARSRPFLNVACHGEELGSSYCDTSCGQYEPEEDEVDELEQWLLEGEGTSDDENMDEE